MFLGGAELVTELKKSLGDAFNEERIAQVGYELSLGNEIYLTDNINGTKELIAENSQVTIKPGQFALLLTKENIEISDDIIGFISVKFGVKKKGLINISGFHVDPGFKGKIKFSVYNAGPSPITLDRDAPYFLIWLSQLTSAATKPYNGNHEGQQHIDGNDINDLKGEIASPNALLSLITENRTQLTMLFNDTKTQITQLLWGAGITITLLVAVCVNLCFKNSAFEDGYKLRFKEESLTKKIDSLTNAKVDSALKLRNLTKGKDSIKNSTKQN